MVFILEVTEELEEWEDSKSIGESLMGMSTILQSARKKFVVICGTRSAHEVAETAFELKVLANFLKLFRVTSSDVTLHNSSF